MLFWIYCNLNCEIACKLFANLKLGHLEACLLAWVGFECLASLTLPCLAWNLILGVILLCIVLYALWFKQTSGKCTSCQIISTKVLIHEKRSRWVFLMPLFNDLRLLFHENSDMAVDDWECCLKLMTVHFCGIEAWHIRKVKLCQEITPGTSTTPACISYASITTLKYNWNLARISFRHASSCFLFSWWHMSMLLLANAVLLLLSSSSSFSWCFFDLITLICLL